MKLLLYIYSLYIMKYLRNFDDYGLTNHEKLKFCFSKVRILQLAVFLASFSKLLWSKLVFFKNVT